MERFDTGDDERLAAMVEAGARGREVLVTREGDVVAEIRLTKPRRFDLDGLIASRAAFSGARVQAAATLVRDMRDMDAH